MRTSNLSCASPRPRRLEKNEAKSGKARQAETSAGVVHHQIRGYISREDPASDRGCGRLGVPMSEHEPGSPLATGDASEISPREQSGDSKLTAACLSVLG